MTPDAVPSRLRIVSRLMAAACLFYAAGLAVAHVWLWTAGDRVGADIREITAPLNLEGGLTVSDRLAGLLIAGFAISLGIVALLYLARAFLAFANGRIFTPATIGKLRMAAIFALASAVAGLVQGAFVSVVLSWSNPPGSRVLAIGISSGDLANFLQAGLLFVLAWVFAEGRKMSDELKSFI